MQIGKQLGKKDKKRRDSSRPPQHHLKLGSPGCFLHPSSSVLALVSIQSESPNGKGNIAVPPVLPALLEK